ncbi:MAG: 3-deoxy-D-manno-octulosonic acid transferase, partial [Lysobacter sp.]|nr:3-deoxy-D-manno-octulosonic acid transferase [Lysobacter sp.]
AAAGVAIVTGPHLHNFEEISRRLEEAGALRVGDDKATVQAALAQLLAEPVARERMVEAGRRLVDRGRGALAQTLILLQPALPPVPGGYAVPATAPAVR